ncbi:MAG: hypothetical protein LBS11_00195 [Oscillospiraceae bacterium]|jgi:transcription antitermination factor NusG|nr:hypothetical protein [Oscillospiraceae bacterium]
MPETGRKYGCAFCKSGLEDTVAKQMGLLDKTLAAYSVYQMKHKSSNGKRSFTKTRVFPGYVFFEAADSCPIGLLRNIPALIRVLTRGDGEWQLEGKDKLYARWIIEHQGIIGVSECVRVGDKLVFISGYLKDYEPFILKIDKHNRNCYVALVFSNVSYNIWAPFVFTDEYPKPPV